MKVGDKVIVNPKVHREYRSIWGVPMEKVKDRIIIIRRMIEHSDEFYCYIEGNEYIFPCRMFILADGTLFLAIHERRHHEER